VTIKSLYSFEVLSFFNFFFQWNKTINIFFRIFHSRNLPRIYGFKVFLDDLEVIRLINTIKSTMSVSFFFKSQQKKIADLSILAYISSSCNIILGMPLRIGNFLPVPGHIK
jgi:hypothetical protein